MQSSQNAAARRIYEQWAGNHHFEMYDDVAAVLKELWSRGYVLGVISNSHRSLDSFKEHFKLNELISTAVSSAEHGGELRPGSRNRRRSFRR